MSGLVKNNNNLPEGWGWATLDKEEKPLFICAKRNMHLAEYNNS